MAGPQSASFGEMYQRLLQMQYFSRHPTGTPLFVEDWTFGRAYTITTSGTGLMEVVNGSDTVQQPSVFNSKAMCKLRTPATGAAAATTIFYNLMPLPNMRLGMEVNFALPYNTKAALAADVDVFNFCMRLHKIRDGVLQMLAPTIAYIPADDTFYLQNCGVAWPGIILLEDVFDVNYCLRWFLVWHNLKFIVDFDTERTVRAFFNDIELTGARDKLMDPAVAFHPQPLLQFMEGIGDDGVEAYMFLGNMIYTMEEP